MQILQTAKMVPSASVKQEIPAPETEPFSHKQQRNYQISAHTRISEIRRIILNGNGINHVINDKSQLNERKIRQQKSQGFGMRTSIIASSAVRTPEKYSKYCRIKYNMNKIMRIIMFFRLYFDIRQC